MSDSPSLDRPPQRQLLTWLLSSAMLLLGQGSATGQFRAEVRYVYVDVFVSGPDGEAIEGLGEDNFEIRDDGRVQDFRLVDASTLSTSAVLLLDTSGSLTDRDLGSLRTAAHRFVSRLRPVDEAGLVTTTHRVHLRSDMTSDFSRLHESIDRPIRGGATSLHDAVFASLGVLEGGSGRPLLVVFSDGIDNTSWLDADQLIEQVKASEAIIYVVQIQRRQSVGAPSPTGDRRSLVTESLGTLNLSRRRARTLVDEMAKHSGGDVLSASGENLPETYEHLLEEMGARYVLAFDASTKSAGWHELRVRLRGFKGTIRTRSGYFAARPH